ncbi:M3 family metallopeptidase [Candidatus Gracilibacteria bacterium]|nr:M3 family metallopeptidase [Candidatus Gracilibacteria bacterium]NUJ98887.1 M3 family metallopeptidase [Candidatus Gracilibacteria bacterium]
MKKEELKKKLKENIPDLQFFYKEENLSFAPQFLEELLQEEKEDFFKKEEMKEEEINFEAFHEFSYLDVYFSFLDHLDSVKSNDRVRKVIEDFEPKYIEFSNEVAYSKKYYLKLLFCLERCNLDGDQKRVIEQALKYYHNRGIHLDTEKQEKIKKINQELSKMSQDFEHNVLDDELEFEYFFTDEALLGEMPEDDIKIAHLRAKEKGKEGYFFDLSYSSYPLVLAYCVDSEIRRYFYNSKNNKASKGKYDNSEIILKTLQLRREKALLLGYNNYAEYSLSLKMAESPEKLKNMIEEIQKKVEIKAQEEIKILKEFFSLQEINTWDTGYYLKKYKKEKYGFEAKVLKKYFEFESVLSGLWKIVKKLYDIDVIPIIGEEKVNYGEDIRLYEVKKEGKLIAYFMGDYFYREGKRGGAWENDLRNKFISGKETIFPFVTNTCSFQKNKEGNTLLSLGDVETIFHEFGHALHEMSLKSPYGDLSIGSLEWDFVELPSQLMENWCREFDALKEFAYDINTGEQIPKNIIDLMEESENFGQGIMLLRQIEFTLLDLFFHMMDLPQTYTKLEENINDFLKNYSLLKKDKEFYKPYLSFRHIFAGAYSAGYYSYMWAEIIEAQVFAQFKKHGIFDTSVSSKFYNSILSEGSRKDADILLYNFLGENIDIGFYLKKYKIN